MAEIHKVLQDEMEKPSSVRPPLSDALSRAASSLAVDDAVVEVQAIAANAVLAKMHRHGRNRFCPNDMKAYNVVYKALSHVTALADTTPFTSDP
jgi:hypothetical protein